LLSLGTLRTDTNTGVEELVVAHSIPVEAVMSTTLVTVKPDTTVQQAVKVLREKRIGCVLVTHNSGMVGILSYLDILDSALAEGDEQNEQPPNFEETQPIELAEIFSLREQLVRELHDFEVDDGSVEESLSDKAQRMALASREVSVLKDREGEAAQAIQQVMEDVASQLDEDEPRDRN
jgi:CBS domain-containing protein